ncbi:MAG: hypothetical protein IGS50_22100 [Synechococcales cyanobacterium C42_A2020_086]|nr:hypothetical protein [Synechococcales cyanobacterium C42_A2020_086]
MKQNGICLWHRLPQFLAVPLAWPPTHRNQWFNTRRCLAGLLCSAGLTGGLTGGLIGLSTVLIADAIRPLPVYAYTHEELVTVQRAAGEDYNALMRRAELAARAAAQQNFDRDILVNRVAITVLGQNGGQTAPLLVLDVSRADWRSRPDPQRWATYYSSARRLLELEGFDPSPEFTPGTSPQSPSAVPAILPP